MPGQPNGELKMPVKGARGGAMELEVCELDAGEVERAQAGVERDGHGAEVAVDEGCARRTLAYRRVAAWTAL
jgi:hypothetical protein